MPTKLTVPVFALNIVLGLVIVQFVFTQVLALQVFTFDKSFGKLKNQTTCSGVFLLNNIIG